MDPTQNKDSFDSFGPGGNNAGGPVGGQAASVATPVGGEQDASVTNNGTIISNPMAPTGLDQMSMNSTSSVGGFNQANFGAISGNNTGDIVIGNDSKKTKKGLVIGLMAILVFLIVFLVIIYIVNRGGDATRYSDFYEMVVLGSPEKNYYNGESYYDDENEDKNEGDDNNTNNELLYFDLIISQVDPDDQLRSEYYSEVQNILDLLIKKESNVEAKDALYAIREQMDILDKIAVVLFEDKFEKELLSGRVNNLDGFLANYGLAINDSENEKIDDINNAIKMYSNAVIELSNYYMKKGCVKDGLIDGECITNIEEESTTELSNLLSRFRSSKNYLLDIYNENIDYFINLIDSMANYYNGGASEES